MNKLRPLAVLLTALLLAACAGSAASPSTQSSAPSSSQPSSSAAAPSASQPSASAAAPSASAQSDEPVTLVMVTGPQSDGLMEPQIAEYKKLHPNVTIQRKQLGESEAWIAGVQNLINSGSQIDVLLVNGDSFQTALVGDLLLDVTDKITYYDRFNQDLVYGGYFEHNGRRYGVPTGIGYFGTWMYNVAQFNDLGITSFPTTYDELKADAQKLKAANVVPIAGFGREWNFYAVMTLHVVLDQMSGNKQIEVLRDTLADKMKFTDQVYKEAWTCALQYFKDELFQVKSGSSGALWLGLDEATAGALLPSGKVGMAWNGNWAFSSLKDSAASSGGKFVLGLGVSPMCPNAPAGAKQHVVAYPSNLWSVYKKSTHPEESLALLDFLSNDANASAWMSFYKTNLTANLHATPPAADPVDEAGKKLSTRASSTGPGRWASTCRRRTLRSSKRS